ncbi:MAG: response regulator [Myxococcales bacterium]|nr:response regulator [Myxococcales bacterium]MDP3500502.1 response regulator [Myxococcales bacterium]
MSQTEKTALVVDDDPDIRKVLGAYLTRLGFTVSFASDGRSAIKRLDERRPLLLCVDLMLPESSGYDVCEHVRTTEALKGLPILMVSARTMPEDRAWAEELGVKCYLAKPFTQAQFVAAVQETLSQDAT